jgi:hypothetical protein
MSQSIYRIFTPKASANKLDDLFEQSYGSALNPAVQKIEYYHFPEDVLALSVALRELRQRNTESHPQYLTLDSKSVFASLLPEHREKANEIRDYYSKKIMMLKLKGVPLTNYRMDLNKFIHNDSNEHPKHHLGIAYWLPEFHDYDIQLDEIRMSSRQLDIKKYSGRPISMIEKLTPVKKIKRIKKNMKIMQYWFRNDTELAEVINLETNNPLIHMWDNLFDAAITNKDTITIQGMRDTRKRQEDFSYAVITNGWTIVD